MRGSVEIGIFEWIKKRGVRKNLNLFFDFDATITQLREIALLVNDTKKGLGRNHSPLNCEINSY